MKITNVETIRLDSLPNIAYVRLHTDEGLVGLGETFFGAQAVTSWIHETAAPYLLGKDPLQIERHWHGLNPFVGFNSSGVENRGRSAVDIALWDLLGQVANQPIYQLLGGATRDRIRVYNTCAGYEYVRALPDRAGLTTRNWGVEAAARGGGPYEDLQAFLTDAGALAESLLEQGVRAMKIWPFDLCLGSSGGEYIAKDDLEKGLEPFRKIRAAVGDAMDIMVELHSLWNLPSAIKIAVALQELEPAWFEDPIKMDDFDALRRFSEATHIPTAASETLGTRWSFRELIQRGNPGVVIFDPAWVGGITESKAICSLAAAHKLPVAPHDCSGPVEFTTSVHLTVNAPNAIFQEMVRAFYTSWYEELVTELPPVVDGYVYPLTGPGLGTRLRPEVLKRPDAHIRMSDLTTHDPAPPLPSDEELLSARREQE
ncbi:MAG TPA: mandelate racemase/muconate lactonizing enzyme family protein [Gaiellaceae bacterium]|nr:mandelate racemase/muconate lactonizing enzyme family protein [Gaiellaceae bacterium]